MKKFFTSMMLVCAAVLGMQADNVWILGTVGDQSWDPSVGTLMTETEADTYTVTVPIYSGSYFSFTTALASSSSAWDEIRPYRFGAPANDYEITDDLLGEPIQCGALGESADNAFKTVTSAMYKITLLLSERLVMFENVGAIEDKPDSLRVDGNIYILGDLPGAGWVTNNGVAMTAGANNIYTANVTITAEENGYFGFTTGLSTTQDNNWDMIAPYRFAAVDAESQGIQLNVATPLSEMGDGNNSFYLPAGDYNFVLDMNARTLTVTADNENHMYILGNAPFGEWDPAAAVVMNETEDGVFTYKATIDGDKWFIFSDARGDWDAVNAYRYGPLDEENDQVVNIGEETATQLTTSNKSYKVTGDGSTYLITFNKNTMTFKFEAMEKSLYILGNAPFGDWNPAAGVEMTKKGDVYTYTATVAEAGDIYFVFTEAQGTWAEVNAVRYCPVEANEDVTVGQEMTTQLSSNDGASYKLAAEAGEYTITFDMANLKFTVSKAGNPGNPADVTGDGNIDVADINAVINAMLGRTANAKADVTGDGNIDVADINAVINAMLGK